MGNTKATKKAASNVWKPSKVGERIAGTFVQFQKAEYDGKPQYSIAITAGKDGIKRVKCTWTVLRAVKENPKLFKAGAKLEFVYGGVNGRTKLVDVYVGGKRLSGGSGATPVSPSEIEFPKGMN